MALTAGAATVSPEEALARACADSHRVASRINLSPVLAHTAISDEGRNAVYVFNNPGRSGYMLLAADDVAYPLLAYADSGSFDPDSIPESMQWWLDEYSRQIDWAVAHGARTAQQKTTADRTPVAPMLSTCWDQDEPFNNQCPLSGGLRTYTGCVATAMAQVMKYWNYPERGTGTITYTPASLGKKYTLNLENRAFEWDKMRDTYLPGRYSDEEADAVAYLMKACGYAVKMDYGLESSGALAMNIREGMVKYFGYDANAYYTMRMYYSPSEWEELIYTNLAETGPVIYGGLSQLGGGHSFVCDGYDGEGFFHFNWGWTGISNGYFSLDAISPDALGSGGGSGGGYNFSQDAVLGIQPPTGQPEISRQPALTQLGSLTAELDGSLMTFNLDSQLGAMWINYNPETIDVRFGVCFESESDTIYADADSRDWKIPAGYGTTPSGLKPLVELSDLDLAEGSYTVSLVTRDISLEDSQWQPTLVPYGFYGYVTLSKTGDDYYLESYQAPSLKISSTKLHGELYYGCLTEVEIEVENTTDMELSGGFAPVLTQGETLFFVGESVLLSVPAHSKLTRRWTTELTAVQNILTFGEPTDFGFTFMDENTYKVYYSDSTPVTMQPNPGAPSVVLTQTPEVVGAASHTTSIDGKEGILYDILDPGNIEVNATVGLQSEYFSYPILACLCELTDPDSGAMEILAYGTETATLTEEGQLAHINTTIAYPQAEENTTYYLQMVFSAGTRVYPINGGSPVALHIGTSGVNNVIVGESQLTIVYDRASGTVTAASPAGVATLSLYSMSGSLLAEAKGSVKTMSLPLDKLTTQRLIIARATDINGQTRILKIAY